MKKKFIIVMIIFGLGFYAFSALNATTSVANAASSHAAQIEAALNN